MATRSLPRMMASGQELSGRPEHFGFLRESQDVFDNTDELQSRMESDGYLFIRGFFQREDVRQVRLAIAQALSDEGVLDGNFPVEDAIAVAGQRMAFRADLANASRELQTLVYGEQMMAFYSRLLEGPARHYDYTWMRVVAPGVGTQPHADVVYMGRGTHKLCTAWVPLGEVPIEVGGLIVLEGSHKDQALDSYRTMDVDTACTNMEHQSELNAAGYPGFGALKNVAEEVREELGRRWLTADFEMGDLLTFNIYLIHGSLDNGSNHFRMSSDTRYQLASEPVDERWVGENPPAHGGAMIRGMIC